MCVNWSRDLIVYSLIVILAALYTVSAQDLVGEFYSPPPHSVFSNFDDVNVSWSTAAAPYMLNLILWCALNGTRSFKLNYNETIPPSGSRLITLDFGTDVFCHFNINPERRGPNSGVFSILDTALQSLSPKTFAAPTSTVVTAIGPTNFGSSDSVSTSFAYLSLISTTTQSVTSPLFPALLASHKSSSSPFSLSSSASSPLTSTSSSSASSPTTSTSSSSVAPAVPNTEGGKPSGLSTGVKAGIIIAVVASVLISAINILYCLRRRVKSSRSHASKDSNTSTPVLNEMAGSETAVEKDAFERHEASGFPVAVSQQQVLHEMEAASP